MNTERLGASFRDPDGFVFTRDGVVLRQVNASGRAAYERLMRSGLYEAATASGDLVRHTELDVAQGADAGAQYVLQPDRIAFISYPYEWCFSQLKDAALLTLRLQRAAMKHGMSLKDATPYNVQFEAGRPVWIDTLSFEPLTVGAPWVAYRQFCEMYVAPLALMRYTDVRLHQLLRVFLDGVPIDVASKLLPVRTRVRPGLAVHVHMHAAAGRRSARRLTTRPSQTPKLPASALTGLLDSLERTVRSLDWEPAGTVWGDYYEATNYSEAAFTHKRDVVSAAVERLQPSVVWDLGANDGTFSRLAADRGIQTIAFDVDPAAVEKNYRRIVKGEHRSMTPLVMDLTNPSPSCGWAGRERQSLAERGPADLAFALALIHHLAIAHNVPLDRVASFFAALARDLVIEFVPKDDSQVQRMLATREDVFSSYSQDHFEAAFAPHFDTAERVAVKDSRRTLYVMRGRGRAPRA